MYHTSAGCNDFPFLQHDASQSLVLSQQQSKSPKMFSLLSQKTKNSRKSSHLISWNIKYLTFFCMKKRPKKTQLVKMYHADFPTCSQYSTSDLWCFYHEWMKAKPDTREKLNQINISIIIIRTETNDYFHDRWICRWFFINNLIKNIKI